MNYPWGTYRHTIYQNIVLKYLSNSDKNCRRRSILKKNHDVTIMTSSCHVTSSGSCPIDRSWPLSYRLSIGTIALSGFVFPRYLAPQLRQRLLRDDVVNGRHLGFDVTGSRSNRFAIHENLTLGSNTTSIGRSVAEIWPFETLNWWRH